MLRACDSQVAYHVQAMPTPGRPARDDRYHHFRHEADEALNLEDVEPAQPGSHRAPVGDTRAACAARAARPARSARADATSAGSFTFSLVLVLDQPEAPRTLWSPPELNAQPPSLEDGPLPVNSTQPTSGDWRAWSSVA